MGLDQLAVVVSLLNLVQMFNINTRTAQIARGPERSMFGYSMTFTSPQDRDNTLTLLVGAPHADTRAGGQRSGAVYKCLDGLYGNLTCADQLYFKDSRGWENSSLGEGFGSTVMARNDGSMIVCSPMFKDTRDAKIKHFTYMIGRCINVIKENEAGKTYDPYYSYDGNKYVVHLKGKKQHRWYTAGFGISGDCDGESVFVAGAPGVYMANGNVHIQDINTQQSAEINQTNDDVITAEAYKYTGYSVKLGSLCGVAVFKCLVTGAPNKNLTGEVTIYSWSDRSNSSLKQLQVISGQQAWAYFGYSVSTVDVNRDGTDELLVGAPYHTDIEDMGHDQGRVFVYTRQGNGQYSLTVTLDGSKKSFSRFGTAISSIGDVNLDMFNDIAVGAPDEDDGEGCVYIYLGGNSWFVNTPSQRISPSQLGLSLKGFGFTLTASKSRSDVTSYPVLAASSVINNTVVILRCRPVLNVTAKILVMPDPLDTEKSCHGNEKCFKLTFCMAYTLVGVSKELLNFTVKLSLDTHIKTKSSKRATFESSKSELEDSKHIAVEFLDLNEYCTEYNITLREAQIHQDSFTPVVITAVYELNSTKPPHPILDVLRANNVSRAVPFKKKCGDDEKCQVDLKINSTYEFLPSSGYRSLVLNYTKELGIKVEVTNTNETAYWTVVKVKVNDELTLIRSNSSCQADPSGDSSQGTTQAYCNNYKPLEKHNKVFFLLAFDTENIDMKQKFVQVNTSVMPKDSKNNPELFPLDNDAVLKIDVEIVSDISLDSTSSPAEYTVYEAKRVAPTPGPDVTDNSLIARPLNLTHKVLLTNHGPSFLPPTEVKVSVPVYLQDGSQFVLYADVKLSTADGKVLNCSTASNVQPVTRVSTASSTSSSTTSPSAQVRTANLTTTYRSTQTTTVSTTTIDSDLINRKKRSTKKVEEKIYPVSCGTDAKLCTVFVCVTGSNLQPKSYNVLNISLTINRANIPLPKDYTTMEFLTTVEVVQPSHPLMRAWPSKRWTHTSTKFHLVQTGGKINIWIIIGSIAAGLVLITLIVLLLWKCGFFKRKKHDQVEQLKREGNRMSKVNYSKMAEDTKAEEATAVMAATAAQDEEL